MIAQVIVDTGAKALDRTFDYIVPDYLCDAIQVGMRVIVPFGPRKLQGFVMALVTDSDVAGGKMRPLEQLLDLEPVLTEELIALSQHVVNETLCMHQTALQAMLPAALRAKYEKLVIVHDEQALPFHLQTSVANGQLSWETIVELKAERDVQRLMKQSAVEVRYVVKGKAKAKLVKWLRRTDVAGDGKVTPKQQQLLDVLTTPLVQTEALALSGASTAIVKALVAKGYIAVEEREHYRDHYEHQTFRPSEPLPLTDIQRNVLTDIVAAVEAERARTQLLFGVTGSGKTEVYLQAIAVALAKGREAIVLVPEISLTPQMVKKFKERFGAQVAVLHSGLSIGEKYDEWRKIARQEVKVVVGARSAIFAPFTNLGIMIIDEEHETSYKQEEHPRYHARDIAIWRANYHGCPVVLGSATPALESFARAQKGVYDLLVMGERIDDRPLPSVEIVDMREQMALGNRTMFSTVLMERMKETIARGEQIVLFLNRRGYSTFVMCRSCGFVVQCPNCDISLTYHRSDEKLKCHYCSHEEPLVSTCPSCASDAIRFFGTGTQKVEEELVKLLPEAKIVRMDVDTTSRKGAHEKLLTAFGNGEANVLLGTQMIAKGLDFPKVTLVGVLMADTMLHLPDFRAAEKTFQLLTQVAGRAGRHELPGHVIIQTYTEEHYSIQLAKQQSYIEFYQREMMERKKFRYVPFYYLTLITVAHDNPLYSLRTMEQIVATLRRELLPETIVLGPTASAIHRVANRYRYQCMIKYKRDPRLMDVLRTIATYYEDQGGESFTLTIDLQPYALM